MRNNFVTATFMGVGVAAVGLSAGCQIRPGAETSAYGLKATQDLLNVQIAVILHSAGHESSPAVLETIAKAKAEKTDVFGQFGVEPPVLGERRVSILAGNQRLQGGRE